MLYRWCLINCIIDVLKTEIMSMTVYIDVGHVLVLIGLLASEVESLYFVSFVGEYLTTEIIISIALGVLGH